MSIFFKIGKGSIRNYILNCLEAILKLKNDVIYWLCQNERNEMKSRFLSTGFKDCVGIIDGTIIFLHHRPGEHFECYYSRKSEYAIHCTVVCDVTVGLLTFLQDGLDQYILTEF